MRKIRAEDRALYLALAREFYETDAVTHKVPEQYFVTTFEELMRSDVYTEGFILDCDGEDAGYALLSKSFSQEAGGRVLWIEELYVRPQFQGRGVGKRFFAQLDRLIAPDIRRLRLEVCKSNVRAAKLYASFGFQPLEYCQMIREQAGTDTER